ncbi:MAG TPA: type 4a pilus biogenesis protein PilO [Solirubrobacterales bacterium]|nr:type 4a pilus biogenesis protein PilO [Solirubrobacterales bacterium]
MRSSGRLVASVLVVVAVAIAFWALVLGPKREEADELGIQIEGLHAAVAEADSRATAATAARQQFPADYRQLVVLGKAVPAGDETSSLLVQLNHIAKDSGVKFNSIQLSASSGSVPAPVPTTTAPAPESSATESSGAVPAAASVAPTEAAAAAVPLGATVGSAGLAVMPYTVNLTGDFFHIADFIKKIDSLVHTRNANVEVDGRLVTLNSFSLSADGVAGFPQLAGSFSVTTYLTPSSQGLTAGATPTEPTSTETSETTAAR